MRSTLRVDAVALIATSGLTALSGIAFWAMAARWLSPDELGVQSALLSLATTTGALAAAGTANALTAIVPTINGSCRPAIVRYGWFVVLTLALALGAIVAAMGSVALADDTDWKVTSAVVLFGAPVMAAFALKDAVCTSLSGAAALVPLNFGAVMVKSVLLVIGVVAVWSLPVVLATFVSSLLGVAGGWWVASRLLRAHRTARGAREWSRSGFISFSLRDGAATAVTMGAVLSIPFLTTWLAGSRDGAEIGMMLPIAQGVDLITVGIASALTKHLAETSSVAVVRRATVVTGGVGLVAAVAIAGVLGPIIIAVVGDQYDAGRLQLILVVLCIGGAARSAYVIWAGVVRAQLKPEVLLRTNLVAAVLVWPPMVWATWAFGSLGAAVGLSAGSVLMGAAGGVGIRRIVAREYFGPSPTERPAREGIA